MKNKTNTIPIKGTIVQTILNDLFTDSVKRYSTIESGKKAIESIHFTADNFDKFWSDLESALRQVQEETREEELRRFVNILDEVLTMDVDNGIEKLQGKDLNVGTYHYLVFKKLKTTKKLSSDEKQLSSEDVTDSISNSNKSEKDVTINAEECECCCHHYDNEVDCTKKSCGHCGEDK